MGDLTRKHVPYPSQKELIGVLETLKELTVSEACEALKLNARRYYRWRARPESPAVKTAWNRITPEEEGAYLQPREMKRYVICALPALWSMATRAVNSSQASQRYRES